MKPIVPTEMVSDLVLKEGKAISFEGRGVFRGVSIGADDEVPAQEPGRISAAIHPYRTASKRDALASAKPVIVRMLWGFLQEDESDHFFHRFREMVHARQRMTKSPAPKVLGILGSGGRVQAIVEEYLVGIPLDAVCRQLILGGKKMPIPLALAIVQGILPLWTHALPFKLQVSAQIDHIFIDASGMIRVLPTYRNEETRHIVGAALLSLHDIVAMTSPEEVLGEHGDARSAMFYVGVLLYELITGTHPAGADRSMLFETLTAIAQRDPPHVRLFRPDVHPVVASFVHRCLARDPHQRFGDWDELVRVYAGMQALFPATGPAELATYAKTIVPEHPAAREPAIQMPNDWRKLPKLHYVPMTLDKPSTVVEPQASAGRWKNHALPKLDPDAIYGRIDARPMVRVSDKLLVDARPVTRAELERCFYALRQPLPVSLEATTTVQDDDACVLVSYEMAETYANWAGKRLPTEEEWDAAREALGAERLGVGKIWEWTATPHEQSGWVVRGGRWRDQFTLPAMPENRSFSTKAAADIGFRCVADAPEPDVRR